MSTKIDWHHELDEALERATEHAPNRHAADYARAGHRAVRRQRAAIAVAALTTAAVIGGLAWATMPGEAVPADTQVAADGATGAEQSPSPSPSSPQLAEAPADVTQQSTADDELFTPNDVVAARGDGQLVVRQGWVVDRLAVVEMDDDPLLAKWGLATSREDSTDATWTFLTWDSNSWGAVTDPAGKRFASFDRWLWTTWAEQSEMAPTSVGRIVDGELRLAPMVEALETVEHPQEAAAFGPVDEQVAAKLRLPDGVVTFALVGPTGATTVDSEVLDVLGAVSMDTFLDYLQAQGDSGEGLR